MPTVYPPRGAVVSDVKPVSTITTQFIALLKRAGLDVRDMRGHLPTHPTKKFETRDPAKLEGLCGHHTGGPMGDWRRFKAVADYHIGPNHVSSTGCPGILYTLGIAQGGEVCIFHDLDVKTWSQGTSEIPGDENADYLATLILGNFKSDDHEGGEPTIDQMLSFLAVCKVCRSMWGYAFDYTGHFQFGKPACPGATLEGIVRAAATHVVRDQVPINVVDGDTTTFWLQGALQSLGYDPGPVDGIPGPSTRSAVCSFQKDHGLVVDGVAGPITIAAIKEAQA